MNNGNGALFRNRTSTLREFDLKSQAQFHPKIAPTQYNNHFIKFILKLQNPVAQIKDFLVCTNILLIQ